MKLTALLIPLILLLSCGEQTPAERIVNKHLKAVGKTNKIKTLETAAKCSGPDGNYITKTSSSFRSDYVLFQQDYSYKSAFYSVVYSKEKGFGLDSSYISQGPLSTTVIAVLKAHEFHEMMMQPQTRYFSMQLGGDTTFYGQKCQYIDAVDHLDLPVKLYFDSQTHLMAGISQANPFSKGEVISVHFLEWTNQNQIKLFTQLEIDQGKNDHYDFDYFEIEWNNPDFRKLKVE